MQTRKKILLIRLDKIGDLVCTLPVDQVLNSTEWDVTWVVQKGLAVLCQHSLPVRQYLELDKNDPDAARAILAKWLRDNQPAAAVSFNAPWWVNFELWQGRVPYRSGVLSQWHSFLFLNHGYRQKRSRAIKHEADYNMELFAGLATLPQQTPILKLSAQKSVEEKIMQQFPILQEAFVVVHPGMMGSAHNLPTEKYVELISDLQKTKKVLITGTKADDVYVVPVLEGIKSRGIKITEFGNLASATNVIDARNKFSLPEMLVLLAKAQHVYAPSTGVLHLAASLGTPCTGYYSEVPVHHPRRWGARGPHVENIIAIPLSGG